MKKIALTIAGPLALALLVVGTAAAGTSLKPKPVPFTAKYSGTASAQVTDQVADISATGKGTGTILGAATITGQGKGDASAQPCVPFTGPGSMVGTKGTKLLFTVIAGSQGCGDEGGHVFSVSGKAKVTGGSGKFAKARGTLKFTGVFDRDQGTFSVKFTGTLTA